MQKNTNFTKKMFPDLNFCAIIVDGDYAGLNSVLQFVHMDKPIGHSLIYIGGNTTCLNGYICSKKAKPI